MYVFDAESSGGSIYKFDATGEPANFTETGTNVIEGVGHGGAGENEIAVDSSGSLAAGDVYVANNSEVRIYNGETGKEYSERLTGGEACGVAVDAASGAVYVGLYPEHVSMYEPSGNPVTSGDFVASLSGLNGVCDIAADSAGDVYAANYSGSSVTEYAPTQFNTEEKAAVGAAIEPPGATLAVDPSSGELYVDEGEAVAWFDAAAAGNGPLGSFVGAGEPAALGEGSHGIAVNGTSGTNASGDVYVSSAQSKTVEIIGPPMVIPDVSTESPTGLTGTNATLEGTVNPDATEVTSCVFEYGLEAGVYEHTLACSPAASPGTPVSPAAPLTGGIPVAVSTATSLTGLLPGTYYHYRIVAANSAGSSASPDATFTTSLVAPAVNDESAFASNVTQFGATLNGTIDPGNALTSYHFEYGTSAAYGSIAPLPDLYVPVNEEDDAVTQAIVGLQPDTTYHFALVASSPGGTNVVGPDETFTTAAVPPPAVATGSVSGVAQTAATLSGSIDPRGWATTYRFEYGPSASYGASWPTLDVSAGDLEGAQPIVVGLEDLQPATVYHYRLVATNAGGTVYGADATFTTPAYPLSLIEEPPGGSPQPKTAKTSPKPKPLTSAQRLTKALRACAKQPKRKRATCRRAARKRSASRRGRGGK